MKLHHASEEERELGWHLSYQKLEFLKWTLEDAGIELDMEEIESVLIFYKKYLQDRGEG